MSSSEVIWSGYCAKCGRYWERWQDGADLIVTVQHDGSTTFQILCKTAPVSGSGQHG